MIKRLALFFLFLLCLSSAKAQQPVPTRAEVASTLRNYLLDLHGGASGIPGYAERLEVERGFPKSETAAILLDIANSDSCSVFGRQNALYAFISVAEETQYGDLEPFYSSTNRLLRTAPQISMLYHLSTTSSRLDYTRLRLDWLAIHPEFRQDAINLGGFFQGYLHYDSPTESERISILNFFRNEAVHAVFVESVQASEMLLRRHDPAWPTNEARRAMMEKWKDDPSLHEITRQQWAEALASFDSHFAGLPGENGTSPVTADSPVSALAEAGEATSDDLRPSEPDTTVAREALPDSHAGWKLFVFGIAVFGLLLVLSTIVLRVRKRESGVN